MSHQDFCLIAFANSHTASCARRALEEAGLPAYMMPTPREICASCGLSLRFPPEEYPQARQVMENEPLPEQCYSFYRMTYDEQHRQVVPLDKPLPEPSIP